MIYRMSHCCVSLDENIKSTTTWKWVKTIRTWDKIRLKKKMGGLIEKNVGGIPIYQCVRIGETDFADKIVTGS